MFAGPGAFGQVSVVVDQFTLAQVLGHGVRKNQPSVGHQSDRSSQAMVESRSMVIAVRRIYWVRLPA